MNQYKSPEKYNKTNLTSFRPLDKASRTQIQLSEKTDRSLKGGVHLKCAHPLCKEKNKLISISGSILNQNQWMVRKLFQKQEAPKNKRQTLPVHLLETLCRRLHVPSLTCI